MSCRIDCDLRGEHSERAGEFKASPRRVEARTERREAVYRLEQELGGVRPPFGEGDATARGGRERLHALATSRGRDRLERGGRGRSAIEVTLEQPRLDELREQGRSDEIRPTELVEPARQERRGGGGLATSNAESDTCLQGLGLCLEAGEQLLRFIEAALVHANFCQPSRGRDAA